MVDRTNIESEVFAWYEANHNVPIFLCFKKPKLTLETSLSTGKYPWSWEDAEDILAEYFEKCNVDPRNFSFIKYWPNEEIFIPFPIVQQRSIYPRGSHLLKLFHHQLILDYKLVMEFSCPLCTLSGLWRLQFSSLTINSEPQC
ncbi:DUF1493 family protein [Xenorhabdus sp. XENO-10]|uniref:DUF1493 family protein n=1 Tax=Xenorhabdus yunnanensis TaxID=3025878 RepID=A0ABT5LCU1_9GAMM|nr:DUF1493 family protein [Xenorhabdus yunnanensis]MDC9588926.1 DUF1493 family protein [Xenorhabdus yunnanensis]